MADADKTLKLLIDMQVIGKDDVVAANQLLAETGKAAGKSTHEAGEEVKLFSTHGSEMKKIMHEMAAVSPGLGLALKAAFHPQNIGMVALLMVIQGIMQAVEEHKKKVEELAKAQTELTVAVWDAQRDAIGSARDEADNFAAALKKVHQNTNELKDSEAEEKARFDATMERQKKLISSYKELELAKAGGDKAKEEEIKGRYSSFESELEKDVSAGDLAIKKKYLDQAIELAKRTEAAAKAASEAKQKGVIYSDDGKSAAGEKGAAEKALEQANAEKVKLAQRRDETARALGGRSLAEMKAFVGTFPDTEEGAMAGAGPRQALKDAQDAAEALAKNQKEIDLNTEWLRKYNQALKFLDDAATEARSKADAANKDKDARSADFKSSSAKAAAVAAGAADRKPLDDQASALRQRNEFLRSDLGKTFATAGAQTGSAAEAAAEAAANKSVAATPALLQRIERILNIQANMHQSAADRLDAAEQKAAKLAAQLATIHADPT